MLTKSAYFATGFGDTTMHSVVSRDIHFATSQLPLTTPIPPVCVANIHGDTHPYIIILREKQIPSRITMETYSYREIVSKENPFGSFCRHYFN